MNARQEDRVSMFFKVRQYLTDSTAIVSTVVPFIQNLQTEFNAKLDVLIQTQAMSMTNITGYTEVKQIARDTLTESMFKVTRALLLYAEINNLPDLKEKARYNHSDFVKKRDMELYALSVMVYEIGSPLQNQMAIYGVIAQDLADLKQNSYDYLQVIQLPKDKIGERFSTNELLDQQVEELAALLINKLDIAMQIVEPTYPVEYSQYKSARNIDSTTGTSASANDILVNAVANAFTLAKNIPYNADMTFICKNTGNTPLSIGLGLTEMDFIGTFITLAPGDELTREAADFASEGDFLLVKNETLVAGTCKIRVAL